MRCRFLFAALLIVPFAGGGYVKIFPLRVFEAAIKRDYPIMLGTLYVFALIGLLLKLLSDLTHMVIDPRINFAVSEQRGAIGHPGCFRCFSIELTANAISCAAEILDSAPLRRCSNSELVRCFSLFLAKKQRETAAREHQV